MWTSRNRPETSAAVSITRVLRAGTLVCIYIHTYLLTYTHVCMCIYMHMHTYMHIHTHTETYLYFTYHIHIPQALMYINIYVHTFMYVCVFCNIIEYTRQGYIHACYMCMTMSSCMYMPLPCLWERHPRRATRAAPPCPPGLLHWQCVKPSAN